MGQPGDGTTRTRSYGAVAFTVLVTGVMVAGSILFANRRDHRCDKWRDVVAEAAANPKVIQESANRVVYSIHSDSRPKAGEPIPRDRMASVYVVNRPKGCWADTPVRKLMGKEQHAWDLERAREQRLHYATETAAPIDN